MIDYDDGCGIVLFLGGHAGPMNECHGSFEVWRVGQAVAFPF